MKKLILLCSLLLLSTVGFAQKFSTKKGVLSVDNKEIAQVSDKKRVYTFSDLDGVERFKVSVMILTIDSYKRKIYYRISLPDGSKSILVDNNSGKNPMSTEKKLFIDFYSGKYKVLTDTGIDTKALEDIFTGDHSELNAILATYQEYDNEDLRAEKLFKEKKFSFDDQGNFGRNENGQFIKYGYVKRHSISGNHNKYEVFNSSGSSLAIWNARADNFIVMNDGIKIYVGQDYCSPTLSLSMDRAASMIVGFVLEREYNMN